MDQLKVPEGAETLEVPLAEALDEPETPGGVPPSVARSIDRASSGVRRAIASAAAAALVAMGAGWLLGYGVARGGEPSGLLAALWFFPTLIALWLSADAFRGTRRLRRKMGRYPSILAAAGRRTRLAPPVVVLGVATLNIVLPFLVLAVTPPAPIPFEIILTNTMETTAVIELSVSDSQNRTVFVGSFWIAPMTANSTGVITDEQGTYALALVVDGDRNYQLFAINDGCSGDGYVRITNETAEVEHRIC
jgi:hypothetical protein